MGLVILVYFLYLEQTCVSRPGHYCQFSLHLIINRAMFQNLGVQGIPLAQGRQGFVLKRSLLVALYNFVTLHDNSVASHGFVTLHDDPIALHNLLDQMSQTFTIWQREMTKADISTLKGLFQAASSRLHKRVILTLKEIRAHCRYYHNLGLYVICKQVGITLI